MRGEEVSREIPFIFSGAFADTRPESAWGERGESGKGFCLRLEKRRLRGGSSGGSRLEEAESPRGGDGLAGDG